MSDLINRQAASGCEYWDSESNFCSLHRPSAEKTGRWMHERLLSTVGGTYPVTRCSVCQNTMPFEWETPYCPNCGAKMEG